MGVLLIAEAMKRGKMIQRIKELIEELNKYRDAYYNEDRPLVSDAKYDELFDELQKLEEETGVIMANSPTQTVGYEVKSNLEKVKHSHPMLSLGKTKSVNDLVEFTKKNDCVMSLKEDGLTCLLTYDNGELVQAESRGNGEIGEIITHNAKMIENIPLKIGCKNRVEFEGEVIITYDDFEEINSNLQEIDKYKNPRNLAAGSVRQLDSSIAKERHLKFICWKVPRGFTTFTYGFRFAEKQGFEVVPYISLTKNSSKEEISKSIEELKTIAANKSHPIDGLVISYNSVEYGLALGMTGHHPRHSIAFKFKEDEAETTLTNIEYTMGKSGFLTPVAAFEEVEIGGTTVSRASLHNISIMRETLGNNPHKGQSVTVVKKNEIIPQIIDADKSEAFGDLNIPNKCPICGEDTKIIKENDTEVLICINDNCAGKLLGKLSHYVSRDAMNIDGLSEATLERFISVFDMKSFLDIYYLKDHHKTIMNMEGFGKKSADNLVVAIESSKDTTLERFINALSIPTVGKTVAKLLAKKCNNDENTFLDRITHKYRWDSIDGVGSIMSKSINKYGENNYELIKSLISELRFKKSEVKTTNTLSGKTFVITGSVNHFKNREELKAVIENHCGKVAGSVSKNTYALINNDKESSSSKNIKAKQLGVKIISEEDLIEMLGE